VLLREQFLLVADAMRRPRKRPPKKWIACLFYLGMHSFGFQGTSAMRSAPLVHGFRSQVLARSGAE